MAAAAGRSSDADEASNPGAEGGPGAANDVANTVVQNCWNSALGFEPPDEEFDSHRSKRTVKKLRLSKALMIPEGTTVSEACRRMAARRVNAVLLTDANGLLSGIVTDKDIATRVIAEELQVEQTIISKVMTRNPLYVTSSTLAIKAMRKMVQGKFRHLPVVENGEVIAMLDIAECMYDAISSLEKAAEQGSALAAVVEGVEREFRGNFTAPYALIETLRERMFKPFLSTIITENTKVATVSLSDPVYVAAQKMRELCVDSVVIPNGNSLQGIFTSKDLLMRVVAQNLSPQLTLMEKVMTAHSDCATLDTSILNALRIMHDGKFLHIPVTDDGRVVACLDVLQLNHAAISMGEGGPCAANDVANTVMQNFWNSGLALEPRCGARGLKILLKRGVLGLRFCSYVSIGCDYGRCYRRCSTRNRWSLAPSD